MNVAPAPNDEDLWFAAADDVAGAIIGQRIREEAAGGEPIGKSEAFFITAAARGYVQKARHAFAAGHPVHEGLCRCRQESIIIVAASMESRMTGVPYQMLVCGSLGILAEYLERRS